MKHLTRHYRKLGYYFIRASLLFAFVWLFFIPGFIRADFSEDNIFYITLNGENVGIASSREQAYEYLREARRLLQLDNSELVLANADIEVTGDHVIWQKMDDSDDVINKMKSVLQKNERGTLSRCYTIKINDFYVNVASKEEVLQILNAALDKYDYDDEFEATLILDPDREVNVLTTEVISSVENYFEVSGSISEFKSYGIAAYLDDVFTEDADLSSDDMDFADYDLGVKSLDFGDKVEVVEAYLPERADTPHRRPGAGRSPFHPELGITDPSPAAGGTAEQSPFRDLYIHFQAVIAPPGRCAPGRRRCGRRPWCGLRCNSRRGRVRR